MSGGGPWLLIVLNLSVVALVSILAYRRLSLQAVTIVAIVGLIVAIVSGVGVWAFQRRKESARPWS